MSKFEIALAAEIARVAVENPDFQGGPLIRIAAYNLNVKGPDADREARNAAYHAAMAADRATWDY